MPSAFSWQTWMLNRTVVTDERLGEAATFSGSGYVRRSAAVTTLLAMSASLRFWFMAVLRRSS